ncbi:MAG: T9SS type A sorting domain-containing protein [Ignavibacteria bacterium]|nr:T9SS type A sorting domain-containing protein [Ignavibacteria bacterium]
MKKLVIIFLFIILSKCVFAQGSVNWNFPFKVGNIFTYVESITAFPNYNKTRYFRVTIDNEAVYFGKRYFHLSYYNGTDDAWWRYDSLSGNLFIYDASNSCPFYEHEKMVDSLNASLMDSSRGCGTIFLYCNSAANASVFGQTCFAKTFYMYQTVANGYHSYRRKYAAGFGSLGVESSSHGGGGTGSSSTTLIGCVLNGTVYGDTSLIHIQPPPPPQPDYESPKFFAVTLGNQYVYISGDSSRNIKITSIAKDTLINSKRYYYNTYNNSWVRYDSASRNIIKVSSANCGGFNGFQKVDSLAAKQNDLITFCTGDAQKICTKFADTSIFGETVKLKTFTRTVNGKKLSETYVHNYSLVRFDILDSLNNVKTYSLRGIYYNNGTGFVVKGDTSSYFFDSLVPPVKNVSAVINEDNVIVRWVTPYERFVEKFEIEKYKTGTADWVKLGEVNSKGKYTNVQNQYSFNFNESKAGENYVRVKLVYSNSSAKYFYSNAFDIIIDDFKLFQNYPNPFNGTSIIKFKLSQPGYVNLSIHNTAGQKELELVSEKMDAGYYTKNLSSDLLSSGVHYIRLKVFLTVNDIYTETKKMVLIK